MTELLNWDATVFHLINSDWSNSFFDFLLPLLRDKYFWFPFYIFLISFFLINLKKQGIYFILAIALTVGLADVTSSHLIKKSVKRLRPCKTFDQQKEMNLRVRCGSGYSFPSSHAANHFAMAFILIFIFNKKYWRAKYLLFFWAFSISYAQVYVGVHYPIDIMTGATLGILIASVIYFIFRKKLISIY